MMKVLTVDERMDATLAALWIMSKVESWMSFIGYVEFALVST
jgi:hypothetical protein